MFCFILIQNTFHFLSIDATEPDGRLCRLVNDSIKPNCVMKKIVHNSLPCLHLIALRDIMEGEELRYDYGDKNLPWRKAVCFLFLPVILSYSTNISLDCVVLHALI